MRKFKKELSEILDDTKKHLKEIKNQNSQIVCNEKTINTIANWEKDDKETLLDLFKKIQGCKKCKLYKTRNNIVFGKGDEKAKLMLVGEGPGANEDVQGEPFVGRAGQLLTKILLAIDLKRDEVYIGNIIKCRPPENRNPEEDEIKACFPFLKKQIKIIKPKIICTLGSFATHTILKTETPISKLRGKFYEYDGIKVMPTYHPAYLLRNPNKKRDVWEDVKLIKKNLT